MNSLPEMSLRCLLVSLAPLAVAWLTGCGTPGHSFPEAQTTNAAPAIGDTPVSVPPATSPENASTAGQSPDRLRPGNRITIIFSGIPSPPPKHEEKIREDGNLNPPLLGRPVKAAGKTIGKLQEELQSLYVPAFFTRALTLTVVTEERWFYVGGEVKSQGRYIYSGEMTVRKAIQTAGDFTPYANRKKVQVIRANGKTEKVNCDRALKNPKLDLPVFADDQVIVPMRPF